MFFTFVVAYKPLQLPQAFGGFCFNYIMFENMLIYYQ
jgi:hypothetical protein